MSNNKQSSVEWLIDKLGKYNEEMIFLYKNEIEQAKAMHKEESQKIFECGRNFQLTGEGTFEQYYNQTYGGGDK